MSKVDGWFTPDEEAQHRMDYEAELVRRYVQGLPISVSDKKEARRLIKRSNETASEAF